MPDQATHLRELVRDAVAQHGDLAPGAPLIAVSGGAPGVGATTAACGLARELARLGKQVILIDANLARPAMARRFGVEPNGTLADVLAGRRRAVEVLAAADGLRLLPGVPPRFPPQLDQSSLAHLLSELAALSRCGGEPATHGRQCDAIILDAGAGMSPWTDRLWQAARHVLLVATPDDAALIDAYATVKLSQHHLLDGKLRFVINRSPNERAAAEAAARFCSTCRRFLAVTPQSASVLPTIPQRGEAAAGPDGPFARAARSLAADLACDVRAIASVVRRSSSAAQERSGRISLPRTTDHGQLTPASSNDDS